SYTGGTAVNGGVLQVASDANLGAASGGLSLDGGTLRNSAALTTARTTTLGSLGGTFDAAASLTHTGAIAGDGSLTKTGADVLTLTGTNSYAGATEVQTGTLLVNGDQSAAT